MKVFLYDSTFEGLLTAIYDAYYSKEKPDKIYTTTEYEVNFLDETTDIETDIIKFQKVYDAIENKISKDALRKIYYTFLSETKESANIIYSYIKIGFKVGKDVDLHKNNNIVIEIDKISKRVSLEKHRFTGFVRFKEVKNILFANIEPCYNILPIIGNHFKNRFSNEYFIINDLKRNHALVYDKRDYYLTTLSSDQLSILMNTDDKGIYEDLWKQYFNSTTIKERENLKLQKRMMPTRYWVNLTECK